jgi:nitrogen regulatory protein P-II 2
MRTHAVTLVTIIAEPALEHRLITEIKALGASGFTVHESRGEGTRHADRGADAPGSNVRLETLVSPDVADAIVEHIASHYFADYSIVAYTTPAQVVRTRKFVQPSASASLEGV